MDSSDSAFEDELRNFITGGCRSKPSISVTSVSANQIEKAFIDVANIFLQNGRTKADIVEGMAMALVQTTVVASGARMDDPKELRQKVIPMVEKAFEGVGDALLTLSKDAHRTIAEFRGEPVPEEDEDTE